MGPTALALGFVADRLFGDPERFHPVAGFGRVAEWLEVLAWRPSRKSGVGYVAVLVAAVAAPIAAVDRRLASRQIARTLFSAGVLWSVLGGRSLDRAASALAKAVEAGDLEGARRIAPALVGRDPSALDADGLLRAAIESVAENTSDAVVASLLWAVFGPAAAAGHRAINTLDAMVGHPTERHRQFGWAAARADDAVNWPSARLTVLLAGLCSSQPLLPARALHAGRSHPSPNAGPTEAAFATALGIEIGGQTVYRYRSESRPQLGAGPSPTVADVRRAVRLALAVDISALAAAALLTYAWRPQLP